MVTAKRAFDVIYAIRNYIYVLSFGIIRALEETAVGPPLVLLFHAGTATSIKNISFQNPIRRGQGRSEKANAKSSHRRQTDDLKHNYRKGPFRVVEYAKYLHLHQRTRSPCVSGPGSTKSKFPFDELEAQDIETDKA